MSTLRSFKPPCDRKNPRRVTRRAADLIAKAGGGTPPPGWDAGRIESAWAERRRQRAQTEKKP